MPAAERREQIVGVATTVFAERGYDGASIDEIARRSGVSAPVVYDHFASKQDLYERLLERTRDELLAVWREHLFSDEPAAVRIPRAIAAWAGYVEAHRDAARMYFRDPTGVPAVQAFHAAIHDQGRAALARSTCTTSWRCRGSRDATSRRHPWRPRRRPRGLRRCRSRSR